MLLTRILQREWIAAPSWVRRAGTRGPLSNPWLRARGRAKGVSGERVARRAKGRVVMERERRRPVRGRGGG
jgi:hypothetical protein